VTARQRRAQLSAQVAALRATVDRCGEQLRQLETHPTWRLLVVADLAGPSAVLVQAAADELRTAWAGQLALTAHVDLLAACCRGGRIRRGDDGAVRRLLDHPSVTAAAVDGDDADGMGTLGTLGTEPSTTGERTVSEVLAGMSTAYGRVVETVRRAGQVWSVGRDRLARAGDELSQAIDAGTAVGVHAGAAVQAVVTAVADLQERVRTDPLTVDDDEIDDAVLRATRSAAGVRRGVDTRAAFPARVAEVAVAVAAAQREVRLATGSRLDARRYVREDGTAFVRVSTTELRRRASELVSDLRAAVAVADADWELTDRRVVDVADRAVCLFTDAQACRSASTQAMATRDLLRGRLAAFRAKSSALHGSEDDALEQLHRAASDELYRAPCDLPAAIRVVATYVAAVEALPVSVP
jgi:hypothetical protein